jgi:hypothetical protein
MAVSDRRAEWFVPKFGPERFRIAVGLLFLPYTGMVLSFTVIGAMLAETVSWERVGAGLSIYFLALGIGAHAFDAVGSTAVKPWGTVFSNRTLWLLGFGSLAAAYAIAIYYMVTATPLLWPIALAEGFLLLAYNLEWFGGRLHTDGAFILSWGILPVIAGYVLQTNALAPAAVVVGLAMGLVSYVEISASRPYKEIKRLAQPNADQLAAAARYERILKGVSLGTILLGLGLALYRAGF